MKKVAGLNERKVLSGVSMLAYLTSSWKQLSGDSISAAWKVNDYL